MNKIMVLGTASGVGKSTIATALCRYYKNRGFKVAPFKAMNISLNSYVTEDGLEMGRAQVVQSEACELKPMAYMNPILLKPSGNNKTQVIVNGKVHCMMDSYKYKELNKELKKIVKETFDNFSKKFEVIILEGSGSCAEINLKETDIANMSMAKAADADVILVADIDRGGVFASVVGTLMLLEEEERSRVKGVIINKFRGNVDYFKDAMKQLEEIINIPVLGVNNPDLIIIPGTKNTINDLRVIKQNGIFDKINELKNKGKIILGICGGYQMLGDDIIDSEGIEGEITSEKGFGFLSIDTRFSKEKITRQTKGYIKNISDSLNECIGIKVFGYEIHNGTTTIKNKEQIFIENENGDILGTFNKNVIGTYLHGIFDDNNFLNSFINKLMINKGINILDKELMNYKKYKLTQYDELTKLFEENIDLNRIFNK